MLHCELPKPKGLRLSNWEQKPLTPEQQGYAAADAFASLAVGWAFMELPLKITLSQELMQGMRERVKDGEERAADEDVEGERV